MDTATIPTLNDAVEALRFDSHAHSSIDAIATDELPPSRGWIAYVTADDEVSVDVFVPGWDPNTDPGDGFDNTVLGTVAGLHAELS